MNTLPQGGEILANGVVFKDQPTNTFYVDPASRRIRGMDAGLPAMRQAVEIALSVERFRWGIYSPNFGADFTGIIGRESGYAAAALLQRVRDALSADSRVLGVENYRYTASGGTLTASLTVRTVYGDIQQTVEVRTDA